jgi:hypothetical protein
MAAPEPGRRLPDTDVADVDAATDSFHVAEPLCHLSKPSRIKAGGILQKDEGAVRLLTKARIELAHHLEQAVCLLPHLMFVVDDEARDAARETASELPDHSAARILQHIDAAVQVDRRQVQMRGHEPQNVVKLAWRVGIHFGGQAHLGEPEPGQLEQRIIPCYPPLEQAMNRPRHLSVRHIHLTNTGHLGTAGRCPVTGRAAR